MRAGQLDRTITLYAPGTATDDGYTSKPAMTLQGTRKARFIPERATEIYAGGGRQANVPIVLEVRSDPLTRQIDATWRVVMDGRTHDVTGTQEIGRREGIRISAVTNDRQL